MFLLGISVLSAAVSCERNMEYELDSNRVSVSFNIVIQDAEPAETKSLLPVPDIETKLTSLTVGAYQNGNIVDRRYFTGTFTNLELTVDGDKEFNVYVLANMGDMRPMLPVKENELSSLTYGISSYTGSNSSLSERGLPMCGMAEYEIGVSELGAITLKRLMAKVIANMSCDWAGAKIQSAKVYNMNKILRPFGFSSATGSDDMLPFYEVEVSGVPSSSLFAVFYVPENMQDLSGAGITNSNDKAADRNAIVAANADRLTYLETEVVSTGKYEGTVRYRSYLGANAISDFSIIGNKRYSWTIHYYSTKIDDFTSDWKHDLNELTVADYSLSLAPTPYAVSVGNQFNYTTTLTKNILYPTASSSSQTLSNSDSNLVWESDNSTVATVNNGVVTGIAHGTTIIRARYTPTGPDFSERIAVATVNVNSVAHELVISPSAPAAVDWQETIHLSAIYYTLTNGVRDAGVNVTLNSGTSWSRVSGSSNISVAKGSTYADVTATNYGVARIGASYAGISAEPVEVTFHKTTHSLVVSPSSSIANVGQKINLTATYYTYVDGVQNNAVNVTVASGTAWTRQSGASNISVTKGTAYAEVTAVTGTTHQTHAVIRATYAGESATSNVTFNDVIEYSLVITPETQSGRTYLIPGSLTAMFYTITNGVANEGQNVTASASWSTVDGTAAKYTVSGGIVSAAVTPASPSVAGSAKVQASYNGKQSNKATVTFVDVQDHELELVKTSAGNGDYQHPVTFRADYWNTTNGFRVGSASNVTSSATWSVTQPLSPNRYTISGGSVSANASVGNHSVAGSPMVTATYSGKTSPQATATFVDVMTYPVNVRLDDGTDANGTKLAVGAQKKFKAWYEVRTNGYVTSSGYQSATWAPGTGSSGSVTITPATSNNPTVTGVTSGSVVLTATVQGHTGTATITVIPWSDDWDDPGEEIEL